MLALSSEENTESPGTPLHSSYDFMYISAVKSQNGQLSENDDKADRSRR